MSSYPYSSGNLLESRNTYFYTPFEGYDFLIAWRRSRRNILESLKQAEDIPGTKDGEPIIRDLLFFETEIKSGNRIKSKELLKAVYHYIGITGDNLFKPELELWLNRLVKKFEVTKRMHEEYGEDFKAADKKQYKDLSLYMLLAEVFAAAYEKSGRLPYLNVLLKVMDTLCAMHNELNKDLSFRLSILIMKEDTYIRNLAAKAGVDLCF